VYNNNLIIGHTSQLSHYFPNDYEKISSRNIDFKKICSKKYDRVFLLFAEQRTFLNETEEFFNKINFDYTLEIIDKLKDISNKLIIYSTSELWNKYNGCVKLTDKYDYNYSPYIKSKENLCNYINNNRDKYSNIIIIYPFNFNSIYRKKGFLFGKVFDSILNDEKITIGDVNFNRDLIHPKTIVEISLTTNKDCIIGSGQLINVKKFIEDIFTKLNKNIINYVEYNELNNLNVTRGGYYSCEKTLDYNELINLTIKEIYEYKISKGHN
jgi:nucleoside-diphosphate-sugar epimerase